MKQPDSIESLLASYPRTRPPLSAAQQSHYEEHYRENRSGSTALFRVTAALESWMHRAVANASTGGSILELGAGNLNHVPYEQGPPAYDAVEPMRTLWENSPYIGSIRAIYEDIAQIGPGNYYDRIISIAVLEHLSYLPTIVARCGLMLAPGGRFQAGIPSEGGCLWGAAWRITTGIAYRLRRGEDYGALMRHEHLNSAREIQSVIEYFFERVTLRRFPFPGLHFSFYTYLEASGPRAERCAVYGQL